MKWLDRSGNHGSNDLASRGPVDQQTALNPKSAPMKLPETILQFGSGRFLRAFADLFIHHANQDGQAVGHVVIVQSTGGDRAGGLNTLEGRYHVLVRGLEKGAVVN